MEQYEPKFILRKTFPPSATLKEAEIARGHEKRQGDTHKTRHKLSNMKDDDDNAEVDLESSDFFKALFSLREMPHNGQLRFF